MSDPAYCNTNIFTKWFNFIPLHHPTTHTNTTPAPPPAHPAPAPPCNDITSHGGSGFDLNINSCWSTSNDVHDKFHPFSFPDSPALVKEKEALPLLNTLIREGKEHHLDEEEDDEDDEDETMMMMIASGKKIESPNYLI